MTVTELESIVATVSPNARIVNLPPFAPSATRVLQHELDNKLQNLVVNRPLVVPVLVQLGTQPRQRLYLLRLDAGGQNGRVISIET